MIYDAVVKKIVDMDDYEGLVIIQIYDIELLVIYQTPLSFAQENLIINNRFKIDLWLLDADIKVGSDRKEFSTITKGAGDKVYGIITEKISENEIQVDCGRLSFHIRNEKSIGELNIGDYIETSGSYQIFFPETEWSYANMI